MEPQPDKLHDSLKGLQSLIDQRAGIIRAEDSNMSDENAELPDELEATPDTGSHPTIEQVDTRYADLEEVPPDPDLFDEDGNFNEEFGDEEGELDDGEPGKESSTAIVPVEEKPPYLGDTLPKNQSDQVKWYLIRGEATPEDLVANGYSHGTVRNAISFLKKEGLYKPPALVKSEKEVSPAKANPRIPVKGSPPEQLIANIEMPVDSNSMPQFEMGMKTGMSLLVTAVRIVQELSAIGVQQSQPLLKMAAEMRAGEAAAAKSAAFEAASIAASDVKDDLLPVLSTLMGQFNQAAAPPPPKTKDEATARMQDRLMRAMEPLMDRLINRAIPGAAGAPTVPQDWTVESQ